MDVYAQQKIVLKAAMIAPGPFKPKDVVDKTKLPYHSVDTQLDRLA